jgi:opacity protein-like surface antigen
VPLLFEYKPFADFGILVGPQIGLNIYKSATNSENDETISGSEFDEQLGSVFGEGFFKSFDFAVALGVQYTLIDHLTIGARYNLGLTNTFSTTVTESGVSVKTSGWKNNVIQVSIGWKF